jgi:precorrin-2 dehydrogenase/sirohydrochlorin ferrochelatase
MLTYPVGLIKLKDCRTVVIGGGNVAFRKIIGLLDAGASITFISPKAITKLDELTRIQKLEWLKRPYQEGDLEGAFLVVAATDDPIVNQTVWEEAQREGCLVNVVDDPAHSNFIVPALVRRGDLTIAISTGGTSPALARRLREKLDTEFGPEYSDLTALLGELRPTLLTAFPPGEARLNAALQLIDSDLIDVLNQDGVEHARRVALEILGQVSING